MIDTPLRILIVEDLVSDAFLVQKQIKKFCTNVEISISDKELSLAVALKQFLPDIVISDFNLEGFTGFDVIKQVKAFNKEMPVIIITGNLNNEEKAAELIMSGASGFFLKENLLNLQQKLLPLFEKFISEKQELIKRLERQREKDAREKELTDYLRHHDFEAYEHKEAILSLKEKVLKFLSIS